MENNEVKEVKVTKLIFNAGLARELLKRGCVISDIKPDRNNPVKTIFAFKNDEHFKSEFEKINAEIAEARVKDDSI